MALLIWAAWEAIKLTGFLNLYIPVAICATGIFYEIYYTIGFSKGRLYI